MLLLLLFLLLLLEVAVDQEDLAGVGE